jgi:hypothetical protein
VHFRRAEPTAPSHSTVAGESHANLAIYADRTYESGANMRRHHCRCCVTVDQILKQRDSSPVLNLANMRHGPAEHAF